MYEVILECIPVANELKVSNILIGDYVTKEDAESECKNLNEEIRSGYHPNWCRAYIRKKKLDWLERAREIERRRT